MEKEKKVVTYFEISDKVLDVVINTLANRPYKEVYQITNTLLSLKPVRTEEVKDGSKNEENQAS